MPIRLSDKEVGVFGEGFTQQRSRTSILVKSDAHYIKYPLLVSEAMNLWNFCSDRVKSKYIILPEMKKFNGKQYFQCDIVPHSPLTRSEAKRCLYDLVQKAHTAIQALHHLGWSHQDVRLPNICFDDEYNAVLVDVDRCCEITESAIVMASSCLYNVMFNVEQHDWLQLGWLAHWAHSYDKVYMYHERNFQELDQKCKNDSFLTQLITQGEWCGLLSSISYCNNYVTVKSVIKRRGFLS